MTRQEQATYITQLLLLMAQQPHGCDIDEQGLNLEGPDYLLLANRLLADGLATRNDERFTFYLAITPKGQRLAEHPDGYTGALQQQVIKIQTEEQQQSNTRRYTLLATLAAIVSAVAAVATLWMSNNSQRETNAQVQALTERVSVLEAALQQHQHR